MPRPLFSAMAVAGLCFFCSTSFAQTIGKVGSDNALDIATWNIEWFGDQNNGPSNDGLQYSNVRAVIDQTEIDLWGVQEISDDTDFDALLDDLGDEYDGILATNSGSQRVGFIYNNTVIHVRQFGHILEEFDRAFAFRPPLQMEVDVMLPDTTVVVTFIVLHMKAFNDTASYDRRLDAANRLKNHIDFTALDGEKVVVLGDFNDELLDSITFGKSSPYTNFLNDVNKYEFLSEPLERANEGSFCSNNACTSTGSMIDHILVTNELFDDYVEGSSDLLSMLPPSINSYGASTSDHLPVYAQFDFVPSVGTDVEAETPFQHMTVDAPYPNPFSSRSSISVTLQQTEDVSIQVYDILGRQIDTLNDGLLSPGVHSFAFNAGDHPAGLYFVRVSNQGATETYSVVRSR